MKQFLIILRGPSGSGKSTLAKLLQEKVGDKCAHLKADYFYWKVSPHDKDKHLDSKPLVYENLVDLAENYLEHGYSVIIEGLLNQIDNFGAQEKLKSLAVSSNATYLRYFIEVDLETAKKRHEPDNFSVPVEECEGWRTDKPMNRSSLDININSLSNSPDQIVEIILSDLSSKVD